MSDPFTDAHRANAKAAEKKADAEAAGRETVARNARIAAKVAKPKFDKPYVWAGPFFNR